jgi:hypothetical protein
LEGEALDHTVGGVTVDLSQDRLRTDDVKAIPPFW